MCSSTRAVVVQSQNLSDVRIQALWQVHVAAMRRREIHLAVGAERDARSVAAGQRFPCVRLEDVLHVEKRAAVESSTGESGRRPITCAASGRRALLHVRQVDESIGRKIGVQRDVKQFVDLQTLDAGNRIGREHAAAHDAEAALDFGDQHVAVGQERQAPGMREGLGDDRDADAGVAFRRVVGPGSVTDTGRTGLGIDDESGDQQNAGDGIFQAHSQ
jgi:hypothetical protein